MPASSGTEDEVGAAATRTTVAEMETRVPDLPGSDAGIRFEPQAVTLVTSGIGCTTKVRKLIDGDAETSPVYELKRLVTWRDQQESEVETR